jgi:ATP-dependent exoDNAse (exonuclease V) alpha subunit
MYLNNFLISYGIFNGTIGVVTDVNPSCSNSLFRQRFYNIYDYSEINENNCRCVLIPLQNCTVHKPQGLTLPRVCLAFDGNILSSGQAYVALSRCSSWDNIEISHLDKFTFVINQDVVSEHLFF